MADRRRRRLEDEGEDEAAQAADTSTETETTDPSPLKEKTRVSECESEGDSGDVELSECDSESAADEAGDQETEEGSESETEEGSETEDGSGSSTETEGGEDYTDEEGVDGERESGDGEEQPETNKPDDDEDRKNPAYVPRKGAFYEHDFRDGLEGEEAAEPESPEQAKPKKKLWQDEGKWGHDHYRDDQQAPKSREELIAIYGYDIRAADKPPENFPRKPRGRGGGEGQRRENKFQDYLPRMAVIDTTEYGNDTVPDIDEDGFITYQKDSPPKNNSRPYNNSRRGAGRGGKMQRNNADDSNVNEVKSKPYQRREDNNYSHPPGGGLSEDFPTPQEAMRPKLNQDDGGRTRKVKQQDNRYRESNLDNRYREPNPQDNRYRDSNKQDSRYRESNQQDNRYRESYQKDNRYRESNKYGNEERGNNYGQNDNRRGGYRIGNRGRGSSNYRQSQDVRQQEAIMNEDNWNQREIYDSNRKDVRYSNNYNNNNNSRKSFLHEDQNSPRIYGSREDESKHFRPNDRGYNRRPPYQGGGSGPGESTPPLRSSHDDHNSASKRNNYRGYEQPPRYQQQQANREPREFTNTSYKGDERPSHSVQDSGPNSHIASVESVEAVDSGMAVVIGGQDLPGAKVTTISSPNVERKSYAKERRAKGTQRVGDAGVKDKPKSMTGPVDSSGAVTGHPQQYINATPSTSTETASAPVTSGGKRYSSQRQQGLSKGNYTESLPVERGANLYNPALPPPSFYQRDPAAGGQQPSSSSPAGVPDAPHFNPSILPPGTTALPYHLPAVPQQGLQLSGATRPPAVFQSPQAPPPTAPIAARPRPALIAAPYIPSAMIYGAPAAPPRVPPPGTPAGLSIPFAYTAPPPPNPLTVTTPTAVSQADPIVLASGQQGQQSAAQQPKKVYRGDITYYAPELQHPSRTPQKRPKSAIPIVDPQEMRRLKEMGSADREKLTKTTPSTNVPATSVEGHHSNSPVRNRNSMLEGTPENHNSPSSQAPKPQRSRPDKAFKERTSDVAVKVDAPVGIPSQHDRVGVRPAANSNTKTASKDVLKSETNHVNSSPSLPLAVESNKNELVDVSRDLPALEKNSVTAFSKPVKTPDLSVSANVEAKAPAAQEVAKTEVVVTSEEAAA